VKDGLVKVSFQERVHSLAALSSKIEGLDDEKEIDEVLIAEFGDTEAALIDSVDRRRAFAKRAKAMIAEAKEMLAEADAYVKRCEAVYEGLRKRTLMTLEACPELPFVKDSLGNKVFVAKAQPALDLAFKPMSKSFKVLDLEALAQSGITIDEKYIQQISFLVLDTDKVRADLTANETLPWAKLKQKTFLRGL
jgi:hypothetical protein